MQYQSLLLALTTFASASASVLPRQSSTPTSATIAISDLSISSSQVSGDAIYSFNASVLDSDQSGFCSYQDRGVTGNDGRCPNAPPINGAPDGGCNVDYFSWSLVETNEPTNPPRPGFSFRINYTLADGTVLVGCRLLEADFTCYDDLSNPDVDTETYDGVSAFNVTTSSEVTECVYA